MSESAASSQTAHHTYPLVGPAHYSRRRQAAGEQLSGCRKLRQPTTPVLCQLLTGEAHSSPGMCAAIVHEREHPLYKCRMSLSASMEIVLWGYRDMTDMTR